MVDTKKSHNSDFQFHLNGDFSLPLQRQLFMSTPADHDLIQEFIFDLNAPQSSELADGEVAATTPQNDSGGVEVVCGASFLEAYDAEVGVCGASPLVNPFNLAGKRLRMEGRRSHTFGDVSEQCGDWEITVTTKDTPDDANVFLTVENGPPSKVAKKHHAQQLREPLVDEKAHFSFTLYNNGGGRRLVCRADLVIKGQIVETIGEADLQRERLDKYKFPLREPIGTMNPQQMTSSGYQAASKAVPPKPASDHLTSRGSYE